MSPEPIFSTCIKPRDAKHNHFSQAVDGRLTVPANGLIATLPTDRMPAVLAPDDWAMWLGETDVSVDEAKACLRTVEGVRWTIAKEERAAKAKREKPTVNNPAGFFKEWAARR